MNECVYYKQGFKQLDSCGLKVASCGLKVAGFKFQVSGFRFQVSGFWFQVSGLTLVPKYLSTLAPLK
jgi:hypothetical protein